jgi:hypothetical protein
LADPCINFGFDHMDTRELSNSVHAEDPVIINSGAAGASALGSTPVLGSAAAARAVLGDSVGPADVTAPEAPVLLAPANASHQQIATGPPDLPGISAMATPLPAASAPRTRLQNNIRKPKIRTDGTVTYSALFGYSQYTWIGWDWKKFLRSLTCLGFKPIQSHSIHMD